MSSSVWDEHQDGEAENVIANEEDGFDALSSISDEGVVDSSQEPVAEKKADTKKGRNNARLAFVGFAVVAVAVSGFLAFKMVTKQSAQAVADEPALPPVAQQPAEPSVLSGGGAPPPADQSASADAFSAAVNGVNGLPNGAVNASAPATASEPAPVPAPPVQAPAAMPEPPQMQTPQVPQVQPSPEPDRSREIAQLQEQMASLQQQLSRSQEELRAANSKVAAASKAQERVIKKTVQQPEKSAPKESSEAKETIAEKRARSESTKPRADRARDKAVITEDKPSNLNDVTIRAIYPVSGKNPQAWVSVGGKLVDVSVGETINGAKVREINPAAMEIVTDQGVVRARQ